MEHAREDIHGLRYYWEYVKRFGKESLEGWWKDFGSAIVLAAIPVLLAWGDRTVLQGAILTLEAIGIFFGIVTLRRLFHTSFILFRERAHPVDGGIRSTPWGYGLWGGGMLVLLVVGLTYVTLYGWLGKAPPLVVKVAAPSVPTFAATQPAQLTANGAARGEIPKSTRPAALQNATPSAAQVAPMPTPAQAVPSSPPTQTNLSTEPDPASYLGRVVRENRGLTPSDRDRLSNELSACDDFMKQSQAAGYKASNELAAISRDRQSGELAKTVDSHVKTLHDLSTAAHDQQYVGLQRFQAKWTYFPHQTEYVLGDNPFNAGEGLLVNAIDGMEIELGRFSSAHNLDQQGMRDLEADQQTVYQEQLRQFFAWAGATLARINQMRQSLDPNGVVQPLPTGAVAPATAFLSLI